MHERSVELKGKLLCKVNKKPEKNSGFLHRSGKSALFLQLGFGLSFIILLKKQTLCSELGKHTGKVIFVGILDGVQVDTVG